MNCNRKPIMKLPPNYIGLLVVAIYVIMVLLVMGTPLSANDGNPDRIPLTDADRLVFAGILTVFLLCHYEIYDDHIAYCWLFLKLKRIPFERINNGMLFRQRIGEEKELRQQIVYLALDDFRFQFVPKPSEQRKYLNKHGRNLLEIQLPIGKEQEVVHLLEEKLDFEFFIAN